MSGGSLDYISDKLDDVSARLSTRKEADLRALGAHVQKLARVLHDVEWFLSDDTGDYSPDNIRALLGPTAVLEQVTEDAERALCQLREEIERAKGGES